MLSRSLSARRAWIEICPHCRSCCQPRVALRKESVDRNYGKVKDHLTEDVALRKESVDRNFTLPVFGICADVALRKESVDRNAVSELVLENVLASLSARRAWIEMGLWTSYISTLLSLSARRAWIEMVINAVSYNCSKVALRKESVDRNVDVVAEQHNHQSRSPQGERG